MNVKACPIIQSLALALLTIIAIPLAFLIHGLWVYETSEKPIMEFCDSLELGLPYDSVIKKSRLVRNSSLNKFSLGTDLVQLHSNTLILGYICFMKFEDGKLIKNYWQQRG